MLHQRSNPQACVWVSDIVTLKITNGNPECDWSVFTFRCSEFELKLEGYSKELEGFRKREVMTTEEMKNNVEKLHELSKNLDQALVEIEVWGLGVGGTSESLLLSYSFWLLVLYFPNFTCQVASIG